MGIYGPRRDGPPRRGRAHQREGAGMNTPFLGGASAPLDAFQRGSTAPRPCILALSRQWEDLTRLIEDNAAYKAAERAAPPYGGDVWFARIWEEREPIEAQISANAEPTVEA